MSELENARKTITEVDKEIARLFEIRMNAAGKIAEYKKSHALPILDVSRENELISRNSKYINDKVIGEYYTEFLKETMRISRAYQSRLNEGMRVAYSGCEGAFAYIASKKLYPEATLVDCPDFESAYKSVENGECDACVLPIENSFAGDVGTVMDLMFSGTLYVNQTLDLDINHCLMAKKGTKLDQIKRVISHPQALSQCDKYIHDHDFEQISYKNTALSAKLVRESEENDIAAIASDETAKIFDLEILESRINSSRNNTTRFLAFSRCQNKPEAVRKMNQHFMLVFTVKNEAGALAKTIDIIGNHGFNMRNLRSRPMKKLLWNYYFFVEADGDVNSNEGVNMLKELSSTCDRLKLVGAYHD